MTMLLDRYKQTAHFKIVGVSAVVHEWTAEGQGDTLHDKGAGHLDGVFMASMSEVEDVTRGIIETLKAVMYWDDLQADYITINGEYLQFSRVEDNDGNDDPNGGYIVDYSAQLEINGTTADGATLEHFLPDADIIEDLAPIWHNKTWAIDYDNTTGGVVVSSSKKGIRQRPTVGGSIYTDRVNYEDPHSIPDYIKGKVSYILHNLRPLDGGAVLIVSRSMVMADIRKGGFKGYMMGNNCRLGGAWVHPTPLEALTVSDLEQAENAFLYYLAPELGNGIKYFKHIEGGHMHK